jgi:hypothetical protein
VAHAVHKARLMVDSKNIMFGQWPTKAEEATRLCCTRNLWIHIWKVECILNILLSGCWRSFRCSKKNQSGEEESAGLSQRGPAAPPVLELPEVASTRANSKCSSTNFIACIAASGMVGTYAMLSQSNFFINPFSVKNECSRRCWVKIAVRTVC